MDQNTVRIFSFNGGGAKGYGANRFVQKFLQQWGVRQEDFYKYADVMCGASIGGILACGYAYGRTADYMEPFFLEKAKRVFTIRTAEEFASASPNANTDSNRPNSAQKLALLATDDPFYKSPYENSNFGHNILYQNLVDNFGQDTLANLKVPIIIPSFEQDRSRYVMFSNIYDPAFFIGDNEKIVNVCMATSAAPAYLPSYKFNGHEYLDGGIYVNDPVQQAINVALNLKPRTKRIVVVDVGCGLGNLSFKGDDSLIDSDWFKSIQVVFKIMKISMVGSEEYTRYYMDYMSNRLNRDFYYYKFNPQFPDDFENEMDNSTPEWFAQLANIVDDHYYEDSERISSIISRLSV